MYFHSKWSVSGVGQKLLMGNSGRLAFIRAVPVSLSEFSHEPSRTELRQFASQAQRIDEVTVLLRKRYSRQTPTWCASNCR